MVNSYGKSYTFSPFIILFKFLIDLVGIFLPISSPYYYKFHTIIFCSLKIYFSLPFNYYFLIYWLSVIKNSVEITTYSEYCSKIKQVIIPYFEKNYPDLLLKDITPKHIQDFYSYKMDIDKVSANTVIHYHANIRKALAFAFKNDLLDYNPTNRVERSKKINLLETYMTQKSFMSYSISLKVKKLNLP